MQPCHNGGEEWYKAQEVADKIFTGEIPSFLDASMAMWNLPGNGMHHAKRTKGTKGDITPIADFVMCMPVTVNFAT